MICPKCGSEEGQQHFCRKCGTLIDTEISTVPITERMHQPPMDSTDILIVLKDELRKRLTEHRGGPFVITFADVDREQNLPAGSTERHIEQAAQESDMDIKKGTTKAELCQRRTGPATRRAFNESRRRRRW
jgi:RNA polymerase subunit RPABC4/transcription elongation factor Spt4